MELDGFPATVELRPCRELGRTQAGDLAGRHHFCFAAYQRPDRLDWGPVRAVNEYTLGAGAVRSPSFHAGFEILTLVLEGALHRTGTFAPREALRPGTVELISTGRGADLGVAAVGASAARYLELWVTTDSPARAPRREQRVRLPAGAPIVLASGAPGHKGLRWRSAARCWRYRVRPTDAIAPIMVNGSAYLVLLAGTMQVNAVTAHAGDGVAILGLGQLRLEPHDACDALLIIGP